ncbi:MAG: DUF4230 domain-containing protein [Spirochaetales bacterium]|nr:DUF4230 domain-containing protein [Spirochaetales bacterium]
MKQKNLFKGLYIISLLLLILSCSQIIPVSKTVIENQIKGILELPTVEYVYREVIYIGEEARFLGIKHLDKRLLFSIDLIITAGVDLSKGVEIRNISGGGIQLFLPEPEILLVDADETSIYQFFVKEWGGKVSRMDYYDEIVNSKENIVKDALSREILRKAKNNTQELVSRIFSIYGIKKGEIRWRKNNIEEIIQE